MWYDKFIEKNKISDLLVRRDIRKVFKQRLADENKGDVEKQQAGLMELIQVLKDSPISVKTSNPNEKQYEVPTEFYQYCLGKNLKYSSGYWKNGVTEIDESEEEMLALTCERAELKDGQDILELGCGLGSLSLYMAAKFPNSKIKAVADSRTQEQYIDNQARLRGIENLTVITADINTFTIDEKFDRVVSVGMFEQIRNYELLLAKVSSFLKEDGKLWIHIFSHKEYAYLFEVKDGTNWISKYFFTGGIMPSDNLILYFNNDLTVEKHWNVNGTHYAKTAEAWLKNIDARKDRIIPLFEKTYGEKDALKWWAFWRIFFILCAELWSFNKGNEWIVSQYLFKKTQK